MSTANSTASPRTLSRRDMLRLSALTATGALVAACAPTATTSEGESGAAPAQERTSIIATTQMGLGQWDPTLDRAQEMLPEIDLTITQTPIQSGWSGYSDQIVTQIAGGEQLDVIMIAIEGLRLLTDRNILMPLDEFFAADPAEQEVLENDIHITLREMLQVDGQQMEYPFSWNNMVMYYNTAIFEEEGLEPPTSDWTWDDFLETCVTIAGRGR